MFFFQKKNNNNNSQTPQATVPHVVMVVKLDKQTNKRKEGNSDQNS